MDYSNVTPPTETPPPRAENNPFVGRLRRRRRVAKQILDLKQGDRGLSFRKIAQIVGVSYTEALILYKLALVTSSEVWADEVDERAWEASSETPERCPECGRVSLPPCLACSLRRNGERVCQDVAVDYRDFDVDLTPGEYERYLAVREAKKARNEKKSAFGGRD